MVVKERSTVTVQGSRVNKIKNGWKIDGSKRESLGDRPKTIHE